MNRTSTSPQRRDALHALGALALGAAGIASPRLGHAQSDKVVRIILPVSAGSGVDAITRAASNAFSKALGQSMVIENQPGAGGVVGTAALIKSPPDGATLSVVSNNHVIYPSVLKSVPFDPLADITPISLVAISPMVLVVNPKLPVTNLKEFIALLKANPGKYNFASSGNGTILHLAAELFKDTAGVFSTHIPYRGFGPMMTDIMGGQVDWGVGALPAVVGQVKAGTVRALCIASSERNAAIADVPTSAQAGLPAFEIGGWSALVGPKGMAPDVVKRINAAVRTAFETPEVKEAMLKQGNTITLSTPEAAQAHFRSEMQRYAALVKKAGVVAQ
jgi:tripartite-type tricarboxylate transporter receptor subunit TctC